MLNRTLSLLERVLVLGTYAALMIMMVAITIDATVRYAFRETLPDVYHLTELYLMPMVIFFALSNTQRLKGHVAVALFDTIIPLRVRSGLLSIVYLATAACFAAITWRSWGTAWSDLVAWRVTAGLVPWPTGVSRMIVPIGTTVLTLRLLFDATCEAKVAGGSVDPPSTDGGGSFSSRGSSA